ncbi:integrase core domain-containing protein [Streptomyces sp. NBC_01340]|uniref:integrase core domain-containing protein n=1 Tax=unclassified Streptomyces TaxID=2593676 RepID=UPI002255BF86|nr:MULTISPECIES: integrase core domain-containing protein [unclassified Streptomyces]MCX4458272.1 integrase core domain-containing protein [Streptomyces sp. NBC_01719]MCX4497629.1 integrase core domain-containing protein [Streptomyces sp. NBC_01728]WSI42453.1 integrase core domain-containing protein [Streptomyces sp. NBC_01340]
MLLRLAYLAVVNAFAALRLLPITDHAKDTEILALRHQLTVLERQLGAEKVKFTPADRAFLAALLVRLQRGQLRRLRLLVHPETILRWHRDLIRRRHDRLIRPKRPGRPPTERSIRRLILRMARENSTWGYRRIHGELATLGIQIAPSTVWEILKTEGIDPAPQRTSTTWADFLRSQADALLAIDFIETVTLTGQCQYILAVIEHATRRIRILGTTAHPTATWVTQTIKNLVMDLEDASAKATFLIRDRDAKFPDLIDEILTDTGIRTILTGIRTPRMNSIMERWVHTLRRELLDRTLIWNEHHLRHALREYERYYNEHRTHRSLHAAAPLRSLPEPITEPEHITHLNVRRHDRLAGILHEYQHAA